MAKKQHSKLGAKDKNTSGISLASPAAQVVQFDASAIGGGTSNPNNTVII